MANNKFELYAPYNFVPPSEHVVTFKAKHISHDHPYEDGLCGEITLTLTNKSPLLIGDGKANGTEIHFVKKPNTDTPYIPGSSLRGMIRNVFEIVTFSKMALVEDQRFSWRDLTHPKYTNEMNDQMKACTGWLHIETNPKTGEQSWLIEPCPDKVKDSKKEFAPSRKGKSAEECYGAEEYTKNDTQFNVYTNWIHNKKYEFVFQQGKGSRVALSSKVVQRFREIHEAKALPQHNKDHTNLWKLWRQNRQKPPYCNYPGIPVFYHINDAKQIVSFGMCSMYRLAYGKTIHEGLPDAHRQSDANAFDLTQCLFGVALDDGSGLKSRLSFGDGDISGAVEAHPYIKRDIALNSPKPTFYPAYLRQDKTGALDVYEGDFSLRGWKRYPARKGWYDSNARPNTPRTVVSTVNALKPGHTFALTVSFHNLRPYELGALLYAIDPSQGENKDLRHSLGMGKPLGWGQVELNLHSITARRNKDLQNVDEKTVRPEALNAFDSKMKDVLGQSLDETPQIKILRLMMDPNVGSDKVLRYPDLKYPTPRQRETNEKLNEFVWAKKQNAGLPEYDKVSAQITYRATVEVKIPPARDKTIQNIDVTRRSLKDEEEYPFD